MGEIVGLCVGNYDFLLSKNTVTMSHSSKTVLPEGIWCSPFLENITISVFFGSSISFNVLFKKWKFYSYLLDKWSYSKTYKIIKKLFF